MRVDEMCRDLGIVEEPIGALEIVERRLVVAELEQDPSHAVDDCRAVGIHRQRPLNVASRLAVTVELVREEITERIEKRRIVGVLFDERLENADGFAQACLAPEAAAPANSEGSHRRDSDRAPRLAMLGFLEVAAFDGILRELAVELYVRGVQCHVRGACRDGFIQ